MNCSRQWGKSTIAAVKAVHRAWTQADALILFCSPGERQSALLLRTAAEIVARLGVKVRGDGHNKLSLLLPNGSRIVALPGTEATVRGFSKVSLLLIDEASRVADSFYRAVRPMLLVGDGDLWLMSTPKGKRGFSYETWMHGGPEWHRLEGPVTENARVKPEQMETDRNAMTLPEFAEDYLCQFVDNGQAVFATELLERREEHGERLVREAIRVPLGTPYARVVEQVRRVVMHKEIWGRCAVAVDATGVGEPVVEMFGRAGLGCEICAVTITSGLQGRHAGRMGAVIHHAVPKCDLIAGVQVLLERGQLRLAAEMPHLGSLVRELRDMQAAVRPSGAVRIGADRHGQHNNLVIAMALGCWRAGRGLNQFGTGASLPRAGRCPKRKCARTQGACRVIYVTSMGIAPDAPSTWLRERWKAEHLLPESGLDSALAPLIEGALDSLKVDGIGNPTRYA